MHGEGKKGEGSRAKRRDGLENFFEFHALLATSFLCVSGVLDNVGGRVMFIRALQCLRR